MTTYNPYAGYEAMPADRLHDRIAEGAAAQAELTRINSAAAALPALRDEAARRERIERRQRQREAAMRDAQAAAQRIQEAQRPIPSHLEDAVQAVAAAVQVVKAVLPSRNELYRLAEVINGLDREEERERVGAGDDMRKLFMVEGQFSPSRPRRLAEKLGLPDIFEGLPEDSRLHRAVANFILDLASGSSLPQSQHRR